MINLKLGCAVVALAAATAGMAQAEQGDTLKAVKERGVLNCTSGDGNYEGFHEVDDKGVWKGVDIDHCRAVATAIFGNPDQVKLIPISWAQRFPSLQSGDVDLVIKATGWTMSRDTELGIQFSMPYFYGATSFMAHAELNATKLADVDGGTLCLAGGTSTAKLIADYVALNKYQIELITFEKNSDASAAYFANRCDAYADFAPALAALRAANENPDGHTLLSDALDLEPEVAAMRQGDEAWVDLVTWVIAATMIAEQNGVTSANVDEMKANPPTTTVGTLLGATPGIGARLGLNDDWAYQVIKQVGNAEEIYDRGIGAGSRYKLPRGVNAPWQKGGIMAPPILD